MRGLNNNDTIAAISTSLGLSGIGIVRLSGKKALNIADKIFKSANKEKPSKFKTYSLHCGKIYQEKDLVEEALLVVMRAPKSYTKEDVVEFHCHGSVVSLRKVLDLALKNGARLAEPGEFTKRAYINGRIDLMQAEAVLDIINSKTEKSLSLGLKQLSGHLSRRINEIRSSLIEVVAQMEARIDFPEDVALELNIKSLFKQINLIKNQINEFLDNASYGKVLRDGIKTVICGRPNVGKSSLLNLLLRQEKAIVTHVAGTTRDAVEDIINIRGIPIRIFDTAGILEPRDVVEDLAVKRTHSLIEEADLVLVVFDGSRKLSSKDKALINKLKTKIKIGIINKADLKQKINTKALKGSCSRLVKLSATKGSGLLALEKAIESIVLKGKVVTANENIFTNTRHITLLRECLGFLDNSTIALDAKVATEMIAQGIKEALKCLDSITGEVAVEDVLDKIFSEFCIGK